MQETQVWSLVWEDPLEKKIAICSSILAWEIPWTEEPGGLQSIESQGVGHDLGTKQQQYKTWIVPGTWEKRNKKKAYIHSQQKVFPWTTFLLFHCEHNPVSLLNFCWRSLSAPNAPQSHPIPGSWQLCGLMGVCLLVLGFPRLEGVTQVSLSVSVVRML